MIRVGRYTRRRIDIVDGVEVHKGTKAAELGPYPDYYPAYWPFTFIGVSEFEGYGTQFMLRADDGRVEAALLAGPLLDDRTTLFITWAETVVRERGYGRRLVKAVEQWARGKHDRILLGSRHVSYGFWVKMGYRLDKEAIDVILDNADLYTAFDDEERDAILAEVVESRTIPDILFEKHPGALPAVIMMEKRLDR